MTSNSVRRNTYTCAVKTPTRRPGTRRGGVLRRVSVTVLLAAALPVALPSGRASAAPASSPSCTSGVGYGGNTGPNPNSTGANGCVVIKYGALFETFNYTGSNQTWTVPAGVTSVEFELLGAGGGKGNAVGGGGGYARGTYTVNPGDTFTVIVGQGGKNQSPSESAAFTSATARRNASFGGGASGQGNASYPNTWASGGGRSAIRLSGANDDLATAGGGGGGGYSYGGGAGGWHHGLEMWSRGLRRRWHTVSGRSRRYSRDGYRRHPVCGWLRGHPCGHRQPK